MSQLNENLLKFYATCMQKLIPNLARSVQKKNFFSIVNIERFDFKQEMNLLITQLRANWELNRKNCLKCYTLAISPMEVPHTTTRLLYTHLWGFIHSFIFKLVPISRFSVCYTTSLLKSVLFISTTKKIYMNMCLILPIVLDDVYF